MAIEDHALRPDQILIDLGTIPYTNPRLAGLVSNVSEFLDYIVNVIYPNYIATVATQGDLPGSASDGDYYIVQDDGDGKQAGYIWETRDGVSGFQKKFDVDWSIDGILSDLYGQIDPEYVSLLGKNGGQRIAGSNQTGENLELEANSVDDTGQIIIHNDLVPESDQGESLGTSSLAFLHAHIKGNLSDGTSDVTVAQCLTAYLHSQIVSGNPHQVDYIELINRLGTLELSGDITTVSADLSTNGNKSLTISVTDDSHQHTKATLPNFDSDVYAKLKLILQDSLNVNYTFNDGDEEVTPDVTVDTSDITDIAAPAQNKILVGNNAGDEWITSDGTVEVTGDLSGSGTYSSSDDKVSINATVENVAIEKVDRISIDNLTFITDNSNPVKLTAVEHKFVSGNKVRIVGTPFDGEYVLTVVDEDNFTIPVDNSGGVSESGYYLPNGSQLLYDSATDSWLVKREFQGLSHYELDDLNNSDDHNLLYNKLGGRGDGSLNIVTGAETANGNLILQSTSDRANIGRILARDKVCPENNSSYAGSWDGTDIGESGRTFRHLYLSGELKGGRLEQLASLPTATPQEIGRVVHLTNGKMYFNKDGSQYKQLMEMPVLTGQAGKALVVNSSEDGFEFTEVEVISSDSTVGEVTNIGTSVETITAPAGAIGISIQADEANSASLRFAWGTGVPTPSSGVEMLQGEREFFRISSDLKVIAESGSTNKLSYTWSIK